MQLQEEGGHGMAWESTVVSLYLRLQFHHALPPFAAISQGLCLAQTHSHELVL